MTTTKTNRREWMRKMARWAREKAKSKNKTKKNPRNWLDVRPSMHLVEYSAVEFGSSYVRFGHEIDTVSSCELLLIKTNLPKTTLDTVKYPRGPSSSISQLHFGKISFAFWVPFKMRFQTKTSCWFSMYTLTYTRTHSHKRKHTHAIKWFLKNFTIHFWYFIIRLPALSLFPSLSHTRTRTPQSK